jgi:hypothetical protein
VDGNVEVGGERRGCELIGAIDEPSERHLTGRPTIAPPTALWETEPGERVELDQPSCRRAHRVVEEHTQRGDGRARLAALEPLRHLLVADGPHGEVPVLAHEGAHALGVVQVR